MQWRRTTSYERNRYATTSLKTSYERTQRMSAEWGGAERSGGPCHSHYGGWCGNPRPHLRLVYEANPLAFVAAACGGRGSDGGAAILSKPPEALHQRTSVFLGSEEDVAELESYGDVRQSASEYDV